MSVNISGEFWHDGRMPKAHRPRPATSARGTVKPALRRDAQLHRETLLRAAVDLFGREGFDVPLENIADLAGVSRTTLFRNFPDRESLAAVVLQVYLDELAAQVAQWRDRNDAFFLAVRALAAQTIARSGFQKIVPIHHHAPAFGAQARRGIEKILAEPLARAKTAGLIRSDFGIGDVQLLTMMAAAGGLEDPNNDVQCGIEKALQLLARGYTP